MPFYRFAVNLSLPVAEVSGRIRAATGAPRGFRGSLRPAFGEAQPSVPPFIGHVHEASFRVRRDIRYRNSFLPMVWGRTVAIPSGSQLRVTMFLHPLVALVMLLWLSAVGYGAWTSVTSSDAGSRPGRFVTVGMFMLGIALILGGFIPEAIKAKRLLLEAVGSVAPDNALERTPHT
jgi:hypothetical protein